MHVTTAPLFAAELTPPRSMNPKGLRILFGLIVLFCALPALVFLSVGAWPIVGFMGLDVAAITWALWASFKAGLNRETVTLWPEKLELIATDAKGAVKARLFRPRHVRLIVERDFNERTTALKLREGDVDTEFGAFLTPDEKSSLAKAFGTALRKART